MAAPVLVVYGESPFMGSPAHRRPVDPQAAGRIRAAGDGYELNIYRRLGLPAVNRVALCTPAGGFAFLGQAAHVVQPAGYG